MVRRSLAILILLLLAANLFTPVKPPAEPPSVPVVLIHGQGGSPDLTWKTAMAYLESAGYQPGRTLFAIDLSGTENAYRPLGLLADAAIAEGEVRRILHDTGASQVDLVGHSRGGLIARFLATGDTAPLVRRVVTLNTPHDGALPAAEIQSMLAAAALRGRQPAVDVPPDLQAGSEALQIIHARQRAPVAALAIATTWQAGVPAVLDGHDGAVTVQSQLDWPGARTAVFRVGPGPAELQAILHSELAAGLLVLRSPHLQSLESPAVLAKVTRFLISKAPGA